MFPYSDTLSPTKEPEDMQRHFARMAAIDEEYAMLNGLVSLPQPPSGHQDWESGTSSMHVSSIGSSYQYPERSFHGLPRYGTRPKRPRNLDSLDTARQHLAPAPEPRTFRRANAMSVIVQKPTRNWAAITSKLPKDASSAYYTTVGTPGRQFYSGDTKMPLDVRTTDTATTTSGSASANAEDPENGYGSPESSDEDAPFLPECFRSSHKAAETAGNGASSGENTTINAGPAGQTSHFVQTQRKSHATTLNPASPSFQPASWSMTGTASAAPGLQPVPEPSLVEAQAVKEIDPRRLAVTNSFESPTSLESVNAGRSVSSFNPFSDHGDNEYHLTASRSRTASTGVQPTFASSGSVWPNTLCSSDNLSYCGPQFARHQDELEYGANNHRVAHTEMDPRSQFQFNMDPNATANMTTAGSAPVFYGPGTMAAQDGIQSNSLPDNYNVADGFQGNGFQGHTFQGNTFQGSGIQGDGFQGNGFHNGFQGNGFQGNGFQGDGFQGNSFQGNSFQGNGLQSNYVPDNYNVDNHNAGNAIQSSAIQSNAIQDNSIPNNSIPNNSIPNNGISGSTSNTSVFPHSVPPVSDQEVIMSTESTSSESETSSSDEDDKNRAAALKSFGAEVNNNYHQTMASHGFNSQRVPTTNIWDLPSTRGMGQMQNMETLYMPTGADPIISRAGDFFQPNRFSGVPGQEHMPVLNNGLDATMGSGPQDVSAVPPTMRLPPWLHSSAPQKHKKQYPTQQSEFPAARFYAATQLGANSYGVMGTGEIVKETDASDPFVDSDAPPAMMQGVPTAYHMSAPVGHVPDVWKRLVTNSSGLRANLSNPYSALAGQYAELSSEASCLLANPNQVKGHPDNGLSFASGQRIYGGPVTATWLHPIGSPHTSTTHEVPGQEQKRKMVKPIGYGRPMPELMPKPMPELMPMPEPMPELMPMPEPMPKLEPEPEPEPEPKPEQDPEQQATQELVQDSPPKETPKSPAQSEQTEQAEQAEQTNEAPVPKPKSEIVVRKRLRRMGKPKTQSKILKLGSGAGGRI